MLPERNRRAPESAGVGGRDLRAGSVPGGRRLRLLLLLASCPAAILPAGAGTARTAPCAWELSADDASGRTVLQAQAYALDRPGLLLTSLTTLDRRGVPWERLRASPDPRLEGVAPAASSYPVTEIIVADPARDRAVLRVPGLQACVDPPAPLSGSAEEVTEGRSSPLPAPGESLIGLRERGGYRPRIFKAVLDRWIDPVAGTRLMLARITDGGGAESGILLNQRGRLVGTILPPQVGSDPSLALAVPVGSEEVAEASGRPGLPPRAALGQVEGQAFPRTPVGLFARAILLTRPDQADEALALVDRVAGLAGEFAGLVMERGVLRYRMGRNDAAIADFAAIARADPSNHLAYYNLGVALGTAGRYREASEALARAASLEPGHARTRYQLILALRASDQMEQARQEYELLARIDRGLADELRSILSF